MTDTDPTAAFEAWMKANSKDLIAQGLGRMPVAATRQIFLAGYTARATADAGRIAELEGALREADRTLHRIAYRSDDHMAATNMARDQLTTTWRAHFARAAITKQAPNEG